MLVSVAQAKNPSPSGPYADRGWVHLLPGRHAAGSKVLEELVENNLKESENTVRPV